jgi:hypothetical protein
MNSNITKRNELMKKGENFDYNRDMFNLGGIKTNSKALLNETVETQHVPCYGHDDML